MDLARFSIRNPVLMNLLTLCLIGVGVFVYLFVIRKEVFPEVNVGVVTIITTDPGVPAADIERTITREIESRLAGLDIIEKVESISSEGRSTIIITLNAGVDSEQARLDIKAEADKARLPAGLDPPVVAEFTLPMPALSVGLVLDADTLRIEQARTPEREMSPDGIPYSLERRLKAASDALEERLLRLPGVDRLLITGGRDRRLLIEPDPALLAQHSLTLADVERAVRGSNVRTSGGRIDNGHDETSLRTGQLLADDRRGLVAATGDIIVRAVNDAGPGVPLSRVATVIDAFEDVQERSRLHAVQPPKRRPGQARIELEVPPIDARVSQPGILLTVYKTREADNIRMSASIRKLLAEFEPQLPPGVTMGTWDDRSIYIRDRLQVVQSNGLIGFVIVMAVLFFFLNYRMAFMTGLGIPVSLFGSMIVLHALGYSANMLTLFGLIVALGMVVDEGIIICENAWRYMEQGWTPVAAALQGTREVFWPVVASALTTMAAFLPLLMWGGVTGQFMAAIPIAVITALAISLLEAMLILPSHLAEWSHDPRKPRNLVGRIFDGLFSWTDPLRLRFQRGFVRMRSIYVRGLVMALRWRWVVLLMAVCAFAFTMFLATRIGTSFLDFKLVDRFYVNVTLPEGSTVKQTAAVLDDVEREVQKLFPYGSIAAVTTTVGRTVDQNRQTTLARNVGRVAVELAELDAYEAVIGSPPASDYRLVDNVNAALARLRARIATLPVSDFNVFGQRGGPPQGSPVEVRLRGENYDELAEVSRQVKTALEGVRGLRDVQTDVAAGGNEYRIIIDAERAATLGMTDDEAAAIVRRAFDGGIASRVVRTRDDIDVVVQLPRPDRASRSDLLSLDVVTPRGRVPLRELLVGGDVQKATGNAAVRRFDRRMSVLITAEVEGVTSRQGTLKAREAVDRLLGGRSDITVSYEGRFAAEQQGFSDLGLFGIVSMCLIYVILATVLRSFVQPVLVMAAVPLGLIGVIVGLQ
ncbi:MAG: efflux RND transporter permease subunit, partial [Planctomycetota bacterium]